MSVIQFGCPFCGAVAEVDAGLAGQETACPACECVLLIPRPELPSVDLTTETSFPGATSPSAARDKRPPRQAKSKLWQTAPRAASGESESGSSSELPPLLLPNTTEGDDHPFASQRAADDPLGSMPNAGSLDPTAGFAEVPRDRRTRMSREEFQRRRAWSNAIMLAVSMLILFAALAGLMYLTGK